MFRIFVLKNMCLIDVTPFGSFIQGNMRIKELGEMHFCEKGDLKSGHYTLLEVT